MTNVQITPARLEALDERELCTELRRNVALFMDEHVKVCQPYARAALGRNIQMILAEVRRRGWVAEIIDGVYTVRHHSVVELHYPGGRIEVVDGPTLMSRVYFRLYDLWWSARLKGDALNVSLYAAAQANLLRWWRVQRIDNVQRKLEFQKEENANGET